MNSLVPVKNEDTVKTDVLENLSDGENVDEDVNDDVSEKELVFENADERLKKSDSENGSLGRNSDDGVKIDVTISASGVFSPLHFPSFNCWISYVLVVDKSTFMLDPL